MDTFHTGLFHPKLEKLVLLLLINNLRISEYTHNYFRQIHHNTEHMVVLITYYSSWVGIEATTFGLAVRVTNYTFTSIQYIQITGLLVNPVVCIVYKFCFADKAFNNLVFLDRNELWAQKAQWEERLQVTGERLAKYVRSRDRLRRQQKRLCAAFTVLLRHISKFVLTLKGLLIYLLHSLSQKVLKSMLWKVKFLL